MYVSKHDFEKMPIYIFRYVAITLLVTLFFLWLDYSLMWCLITGIVFTILVELTTFLFVAILLFVLEIIVQIYILISILIGDEQGESRN